VRRFSLLWVVVAGRVHQQNGSNNRVQVGKLEQGVVYMHQPPGLHLRSRVSAPLLLQTG
jgi:hypothetical protein